MVSKLKVKQFIKRRLQSTGYQIRRIPHRQPAAMGRPVGDLKPVLEDIAARGLRPKHILDVGANHGWWSEIAKAIFPKAQFTLIEPQDSMQPYLDSFCAATPAARWIRAAAGSTIGEASFNILRDTESSSFLFPVAEAGPADTKQQRVPIVTLDSVAFEQSQILPDLVKVDVEGFEMEVLRGASRLLNSREVELWFLEVSFFHLRVGQPSFVELVNFMAENGYSLYDFTYFHRRPLDGALMLAEVVFAKEKGLLREALPPSPR